MRLLGDLGFTVPPRIDGLAGKDYGTGVSRERDGRAVLVDGLSETDVALNFSSALSIPFAVEALVPRLAEATA